MSAPPAASPTPELLTSLLRESGSLRAGRVSELRIEPIGTFSSDLSRLRLRYAGAEGSPPERLVLKAPAPGRPERAGESFASELRFYRELSTRVPVRVPRFHGGRDDREGGLLLLEELPALAACDWLRGPSEAHARSAVSALARLHAAFQGRVDELDWVPSFDDEELLARFERGYARGWARSRDLFERTVPGFARLGDALLGRVAASHRALAARPTLLHGDAHAENLPLPSGSRSREVVLLDWVGPRRGSAGVDLGFFVSMSFPASRRSGVERGLVAHHEAVLRELGAPPSGDSWLAYRRGVLRRVSRLVAIAGDWDPRAIGALEMLARRCGVAALELDLLELVA